MAPRQREPRVLSGEAVAHEFLRHNVVVTTQLVAEPHRVFKGLVDELEITRDPSGAVQCEMTVASSARYLTRTLTLKRSDASQRLRMNDRFLRYADVSGEVDVYWGEKRLASGNVGAQTNTPAGGST